MKNNEEKKNNLKNELRPNQLDEKQKKSLGNRLLYGFILVGTAIPAYVLGGWFFFAYSILFLFIAIYEVTKVPFQKFPVVLFIINIIIVCSLVFWPTLKFLLLPTKSAEALNINSVFPFVNDGFYSEVWLSPIAIAFALGVYFTISVFKKDFSIMNVCYFFTMALLLGIGFQCILGVRYLPFRAFNLLDGSNEYIQTSFFKYFHSVFFVAIAIGGIVLTDVGAYIFGIFFGKHKLNSRISPNKTVEGFVGGICTSFVVTFTVCMIAANFGKPLLPIYSIENWYLILILCLGIPFVSTLGDFAFSAIKRFFGIKDFSHILGSMGGIMDRIDSIIFGMMFVLIFTTFVSNIAGNIYYF